MLIENVSWEEVEMLIDFMHPACECRHAWKAWHTEEKGIVLQIFRRNPLAQHHAYYGLNFGLGVGCVFCEQNIHEYLDAVLLILQSLPESAIEELSP